MIELNKWRKKRKLKSKIVGEIHDEVIWDMIPEEEDEILAKTVNIMENKVRERFEWINVPLKAEISLTEVDQSWYYKKEVKFND